MSGQTESPVGTDRRMGSVVLAGAVFAVFLLASLWLCHGALDAPYYYDSNRLVENRAAFDDNGLLGVLAIFPQRPIPMLTFYLNHLARGLDRTSMRAVNLALLAGLAGVAALLICLLIGISEHPGASERFGLILSLLLGLLYLVHPLHIFSALYVWQRMALMAGLFYCGSLAAYIATRSGKIEDMRLGYGLCLILFVAAMLSKENSVTLPIVLVLADVAFFKDSSRKVVKRSVVYAAIVAVVVLGLSSLERPHGGLEFESGVIHTITHYYQESGHSPWSVILTQCRVTFAYLWMVLHPAPHNIQFMSPQIVSSSLTEPPGAAVAVAGMAVWITAGVYLLCRRPLTGFGMLFFIINLAPEALLVPQFAFFGYRPAIPMLGLWFVAADLVWLGLQRMRSASMKTAMKVAVCVAFLTMAALAGSWTRAKAAAWRDPLSFWEDTLAEFPPLDSPKLEKLVAAQALSELGMAHIRQGSAYDAEALLRKAIWLSRPSWRMYNNLGAALLNTGKPDEAVKYFELALQRDPKNPGIKANLKMAREAQGWGVLRQRAIPKRLR